MSPSEPTPGEHHATPRRRAAPEHLSVVGGVHPDAQLWSRLVLEDFAGPVWARASRDLAAYGVRSMIAMISTGAIVEETSRVGRPVRPRTLSDEDVRSLANEVVAYALAAFRKSGREARHSWREDGSTTITTYFVGRCVLEFSNVYRNWLREEQRWDRVLVGDAHVTEEPPAGPGFDDMVSRVIDAMDALDAEGDDREKWIVALQVHGYTVPEIAEMTGQSAKAVEGVLGRLRRRIAEHGWGDAR